MTPGCLLQQALAQCRACHAWAAAAGPAGGGTFDSARGRECGELPPPAPTRGRIPTLPPMLDNMDRAIEHFPGQDSRRGLLGAADTEILPKTNESKLWIKRTMRSLPSLPTAVRLHRCFSDAVGQMTLRKCWKCRHLFPVLLPVPPPRNSLGSEQQAHRTTRGDSTTFQPSGLRASRFQSWAGFQVLTDRQINLLDSTVTPQSLFKRWVNWAWQNNHESISPPLT